VKRSPLKRRTPLKQGNKRLSRHTRLKATVTHRARPDEPLIEWCDFAIAGVCTGYSQHRHHRLPRSAGGTDDATNTADVCRACHAYAHHNPALAYAHGWLRRRGSAT
jgi:hypothetical protein